MSRVMLLIVALAATIAPASAIPNLRVMPPAELVSNSVLIARARVVDVDESEWADFRQMVTLELTDVIEGDFTVKRVRVAAGSLLAYTNDHYGKKEEWLVFLWHDAGFYRTVNYQYGQFKIESDVVKGWRSAENVATDKPYYSVREELERLLTDMRTPPPDAVPATPLPPQSGTTAAPKPPQRLGPSGRPATRPTVVRPERP